MKHLTAKALLAVTTIGLTTIALAGTDSDQWGEWDQLTLTQDNVAHNLELDKSEIHQGTINFAEAASSFYAAGTELAGGQPSGLDTNMALDVNGIPVDFHGEELSMAISLGDLRSDEELHALHSEMVSGVFEAEGGSLPLTTDDLRSKEELGALDSPMVSGPGEIEGESMGHMPNSEGFPVVETRSEEELGALESFFVPNK